MHASFDPDAVPDVAMADYLGGTVSVAANRPGIECMPALTLMLCLTLPWQTTWAGPSVLLLTGQVQNACPTASLKPS